MFVVCGEALYDVYVGPGEPRSLALTARMGGSPFNVAIGLSRLGERAGFLAGIGQDVLGSQLVQALESEQVATTYVVRKPALTTLSLVALDPAGVPQYGFYGVGCADRILQVGDLPTLHGDVRALHFGSYSLVVEPSASTYLHLAREQHASRLISLDPNVRLNVEPDVGVWRRTLGTWLTLAHVVKVSQEDLGLLYPREAPADLAGSWLSQGVRLVIVTLGSDGAMAFTQAHRVTVPAKPATVVVDTVGAGDSFQAALLQGLAHANALTPEALGALTPSALTQVLALANAAAAITCTRAGADLPTADELAASLA